jgi:hypothetical protein
MPIRDTTLDTWSEHANEAESAPLFKNDNESSAGTASDLSSESHPDLGNIEVENTYFDIELLPL